MDDNKPANLSSLVKNCPTYVSWEKEQQFQVLLLQRQQEPLVDEVHKQLAELTLPTLVDEVVNYPY